MSSRERARAILQVARGMCSDEAPYGELDAQICKAIDALADATPREGIATIEFGMTGEGWSADVTIHGQATRRVASETVPGVLAQIELLLVREAEAYGRA